MHYMRGAENVETLASRAALSTVDTVAPDAKWPAFSV
jgi:hypothetical protein